MQCDQHSERNAVAICLGCSKVLCDDCTQIFEGKNICKECEQKLEFILKKNSVTDNLDGIEDEINNRVNFKKIKLEKLIKEEKLDEEFKQFMNEANERIFGFVNIYEMNEIKIDNQNGFLICVECYGYYELHEGESLKDFECCECGGTLKFNKNLPADYKE